MKNQFSKKMKIGMLAAGAVLILMAVSVVYAVVAMLNPPAEIGVMTVESSGKTIEPLSNTLKISTKEKQGGGAPLKLEEIADSLPFVEYDGDITVKYSKMTLESFSFSMYRADLTELYAGAAAYQHPEEGGTYIVRIVFSWGFSENNSILTENYFKVAYPSGGGVQ